MRQDDPSALKDIVQIVQSKVTGIEATIRYVKVSVNDCAHADSIVVLVHGLCWKLLVT